MHKRLCDMVDSTGNFQRDPQMSTCWEFIVQSSFLRPALPKTINIFMLCLYPHNKIFLKNVSHCGSKKFVNLIVSRKQLLDFMNYDSIFIKKLKYA